MMLTIEKLENKIKQNKESLSNLKEQLRKAWRKHWEQTLGFSEGCLILSRGEEYKVISFHSIPRYRDKKPDGIKAVKRNKSGEWGKRELSIYGDWEIIKKAGDDNERK